MLYLERLGRTYLALCSKCVGSFTSPANQKMQKTGPAVYPPHPRGLECLTICKSHSEDSKCLLSYFKTQVMSGFSKLKLYSAVEIYP